jgi:hypothetical protein
MVLTFLAIGFLVFAGVRNLQEARRAKRLRDVMEDLRKEHAQALKYASAQKLREFEKRLKGAAFPLIISGRLRPLAEDAGWLWGELDRIKRENDLAAHGFQNLRHPFTNDRYPDVPGLPSASFSWQQLSLLSFRERYKHHRLHVIELHLSSEMISGELEILKVTIPNKMSLAEFMSMLDRHREKLGGIAGRFEAPYVGVEDSVSRAVGTGL